jgi:hypothetical protein
MMTLDRDGYRVNNKKYGWLKRKLSETQSVAQREKSPGEWFGGKAWGLGRTHSEETRNNLSLIRKTKKSPGMTGKSHSTKTKQNISKKKSGQHHQNYGKHHSEETKQRIAEKLKNNPDLTCPHCDVSGKRSPMMRWHFENCRNV